MKFRLSRFFSSDIGIDLGTANCLVYVKDQGVVLNEPSVVSISDDGDVKVGTEAKRMLGRCPVNIRAIRPMKAGVIADFEVTEEMLRYFIAKAKGFMKPYQRFFRPNVVIAIPSGITEVESRAVQDSAMRAGAGKVTTIPEPMASAIGVGLPVSEPTGSMIVDIGGGTTEVAVLSLAGIVEMRSCRVGGDEMDSSIIQHMKRVYNLLIGERMAEDIKIRIGSAYQVPDLEESMEVKGRDLVSGLPKSIRVSSQEIRTALQEPIASIVDAVRSTLEHCPPELASDLMDRGIMLAGGGAMIRGLDRLISEEINLPVLVADDPLNAVVKGTGWILQNLNSNVRV